MHTTTKTTDRKFQLSRCHGYPKQPGQINVVIMYPANCANSAEDAEMIGTQSHDFLHQLVQQPPSAELCVPTDAAVFFYQTNPEEDEDVEATLSILDPDFVVPVGTAQASRLKDHEQCSPGRRGRHLASNVFTEMQLCDRVRRVYPVTNHDSEATRKDFWGFLTAMVHVLNRPAPDS
jgi:hypothetical protein